MTRTSLVPLVAALGAAAAARADGGTLTGRVEATPAKYLEETVVYLKDVPGAHAPQTHTMDQQGMRFVPRVLAIAQGDSVRYLNHDNVAHNVYSPDGDGFNLGSFAQNQERVQRFAATGVYAQLCSVHPEMLGYVFVGRNPHAAAVDARGRYVIRGVPPGTYQLAVWNSHLKGPEKTVTIRANASVEQNLAVQR